MTDSPSAAPPDGVATPAAASASAFGVGIAPGSGEESALPSCPKAWLTLNEGARP